MIYSTNIKYLLVSFKVRSQKVWLVVSPYHPKVELIESNLFESSYYYYFEQTLIEPFLLIKAAIQRGICSTKRVWYRTHTYLLTANGTHGVVLTNLYMQPNMQFRTCLPESVVLVLGWRVTFFRSSFLVIKVWVLHWPLDMNTVVLIP